MNNWALFIIIIIIIISDLQWSRNHMNAKFADFSVYALSTKHKYKISIPIFLSVFVGGTGGGGVDGCGGRTHVMQALTNAATSPSTDASVVFTIALPRQPHLPLPTPKKVV